ncbi:hypothetical protein LguiB_013565 [Lonicera macranthoides]
MDDHSVLEKVGFQREGVRLKKYFVLKGKGAPSRPQSSNLGWLATRPQLVIYNMQWRLHSPLEKEISQTSEKLRHMTKTSDSLPLWSTSNGLLPYEVCSCGGDKEINEQEEPLASVGIGHAYSVLTVIGSKLPPSTQPHKTENTTQPSQICEFSGGRGEGAVMAAKERGWGWTTVGGDGGAGVDYAEGEERTAVRERVRVDGGERERVRVRACYRRVGEECLGEGELEVGRSAREIDGEERTNEGKEREFG